MRDTYRKIATALLLVIFAGSTLMMVRQNYNYKQADLTYAHAEALVAEYAEEKSEASQESVKEVADEITPEETKREKNVEIIKTKPEEAHREDTVVWGPVQAENDPVIETLKKMELSSLQEVNGDVIGWIHIPDTVIDYPVLQGEDNHYYLSHTWDNKENVAGSIFMESTNQKDLSDFHTIIYGHNMKSKTMFSAIKNYRDENFWKEHPYIYIVNDDGVYRYEVYASYEAGVTSDTYRLGFKEEGKKVFLEMGMDQSVIETGVNPESTDRILTLSTCTGNGHDTRWVVQACLKMEIK